jgi:hypothetical protein
MSLGVPSRTVEHVATAAAAPTQHDDQRRKVGRPWQPGQSGNPSGSRLSKRFCELFQTIAADFGGADALSAVDHAQLSQACHLMVRAERESDADIVVRLAGEARRLLAVLRKRAPAAKPGAALDEYLAKSGAAP